MKFNRKTTLIAVGALSIGFAAGSAPVFSDIANVLFTGPKIQGGGPYTEFGIGGDPAKGEAASFVFERNGQRPGNSTDDGPALVVKSDRFGAGKFQATRNGVKPVEAIGRSGSVFKNTGVKNTNGNKRNNVAITSIGAVVIKGKDKAGASSLDEVRLSLEGGVLTARFANGNEVVLATEND